ncbi:hypothetical protein [Chitinivibrio alkaliphilus]|uniref:Uncharacterized protein n=1 Tax=Chitinivibrio alkaliphilus ACht1 TaxID=1313304 RepID=U7D989_9BACT|nr:hypothetical protein [Chitinivibrio alkaliphilus]ERP38954.1 hypothetical protein CALK_0443 [Chitinivibrio alkaliphilus ACht1]
MTLYLFSILYLLLHACAANTTYTEKLPSENLETSPWNIEETLLWYIHKWPPIMKIIPSTASLIGGKSQRIAYHVIKAYPSLTGQKMYE